MKRNKPQPEKASAGTALGAWARAEGNKGTDAEREKLGDQFMKQLKLEAEANFRSLNQEVLARVQRTFEIDAALNTKRDQKWIDEALAGEPA